MELKKGPSATLDITRKKLREDIREAHKESQQAIITMVNEDLMPRP